MSTTFCLSVRTECASDDNTTRTDFSHYFRSLAEVVLNTLHLTYKQASKSITTHGWWAEVGLTLRHRHSCCRTARLRRSLISTPASASDRFLLNRRSDKDILAPGCLLKI